MDEPIEGFFTDDGTRINPPLMPKPSLCVLCRYDDDPTQATLCALNRLDQQGDATFRCDTYQRIGEA